MTEVQKTHMFDYAMTLKVVDKVKPVEDGWENLKLSLFATDRFQNINFMEHFMPLESKYCMVYCSYDVNIEVTGKPSEIQMDWIGMPKNTPITVYWNKNCMERNGHIPQKLGVMTLFYIPQEGATDDQNDKCD